MLLGYLALSMIIGLIVAAAALVAGSSLLVAFALYAFTGAFSVICFAALVAFRNHDPADDPIIDSMTPAE